MAALAIVLATLLSYAVGWALGIPILLPILNTAASFPFMVLALKRGDLRLAVARMLLWALTMGAAATLLSYVRPAQTDVLFLRGESYRAEMFAWVLTGQGAESTPSQFIPQQAGHAVLFAGLALATGGVAAMPMGAVLMNYMGHYVGALAASSRRPALTMVLAMASVGGDPRDQLRRHRRRAVGAAAVAPGIVHGRPTCRPRAASRRRAGLVADIVLKTLLAPSWQRLLLRVVGW